MDMRIKRIITKEGLVLLIFIAGAYLINWIIAWIFGCPKPCLYGNKIVNQFLFRYQFLLVWGYSLYIIIRFIIWAVKTLGVKK